MKEKIETLNKKMGNINIQERLKNISEKKVIIITTILYFIIIALYELLYCNFEFFTNIIEKYNFSIYRILVYIVLYIIFYKVKDKFIKQAINTFDSKIKCYFVYAITLINICLIITLIAVMCINKQITVNSIVLIIGCFIFEIFAIYLSNDILKNAVITALTFGTIFSISITFNNQLDEKRHFLESYNIAVGYLDNEKAEVEENIIKMPRRMNISQFISFFSQKPQDSNVKGFADEVIFDTPCDYKSISHFISALGIFIAKILGGSIADIYLTGRMFNFLAYTVIVVLALKTIPYKKKILYTIFFMPMILALGSVYSPDAIGTALAGLLIAYSLKLKEKTYISGKQIIALLILLMLAITIKSVGYIALLLVIFILPIKKILKDNRKYIKYAIIFLIIIITLAVGIVINKINEAGDPRTEGTGNQSQFSFIMNDPINYCKILVKHIASVFTSLKGLSFFNAPMFFNKTSYTGFIIMLTYIIFISITDSSKQLDLKTRLIFVITFFATFAIMSTAMYISYTKVGADYIDGFQMRYLFPVLFLILAPMSIKRFQLTDKFKYIFLNVNYISAIFLIISSIDAII